MKSINLNGKWQGQCIGDFSFEAQVPGCTIADLIENGYLSKDLLVGKNADEAQKYERKDWRYTKKFYVDELFDNVQLRFDRIDTYADIYLNGELVAHTENGNIAYAFDVFHFIKRGENVVEVRFYSPIAQVDGLPLRNAAFTAERLYTRRTQCTYGWDWVARFVACGIRDAELVCWNNDEAVVKNTYIFTENIQSGTAIVNVEAAFEKDIDKPIAFEIISENGCVVYKEHIYVIGNSCAFRARLEAAQLWYPVGYGKQPLYTLRIKASNAMLHEEKFGVRMVEILEIVDEEGSENYQKCLQIKNPEYDFNEQFSCFTLVINGVKIMCKGANWVPCQPYEMAGKEEKITKALELSVEMGLNMVRVWGGGAFECKHFYNECARLGILVTQDFLMACGEYPEKEEWFLQHLQKEAEYACYLMRNQPCLVWYSGDNENAVNGSFDAEDYMGKTAYEKGLKTVVEKLDKTRKFFPSSPYGGNKFASNTVGTTHNTNFLWSMLMYVEGKKELADYKEKMKEYRARFVAEEPVFGAASLSSLRRFMRDEEIFSKDTDMWLYHTKGNPGLPQELLDHMLHYAEGVLGKFKTPQDRYFKFKYWGYEWLRVMMEQARREKWFCSGVIFWMLNDCWTAASGWALIDYFNKPKLSYYSFKRCARPILCSLDFENGEYAFHVSNDGLSDCKAEVTVYKVKSGKQQLIDEFAVLCPANENVARKLDVNLQDNEVLVADLKSSANECRAFYKRGDLQLENIENAVEFTVENGRVILTAKDYVQAVELEGEAIFEDNGFSMLQGEKRIVPYRYLEDAVDKEITVETYTLSIFKNG